MRNKAKFEYVDELRKINTIQKMGIVESFYPQDFQEHKKDNTKFIRYKQLISTQQTQFFRNSHLVNNPIIDSYKNDIEGDCHNNFTLTNLQLSNDIDYYHNWSQSLNHQIKERDYQHKFYFKHAQPPPRNKQQNTKEKTKNLQQSVRVPGVTKQGETEQEDTNIDIPQRGKYNFNEIAKHIHGQSHKEDKESNYHRDMSIKHEITEYRKLKDLRDIDKIGTFSQEFSKFNYYIEPHSENYHIDFVDNSVVATNSGLKIDYFRDIGQPARNIMKYTIKHNQKMRRQDDDSAEVQNMYDQQKRQILYLYFLQEEELKINKMGMTFADLVNISIGRITPSNAHMCVRSQKVTKAQYQKLLKKMEKYDMRQNESGKPKVDAGVCTDDMDEIVNNASSGEQDSSSEEEGLSIQQLIEEINQIKKQVKQIQQSKNATFNEPNFNKEAYNKLQKLVNILYELITDKNEKKYPIEQLADHIHEFKGEKEKGYDKMRLLWFIANIYQDFYGKNRKKPDLRDIVNIRAKKVPVNTNYKGKKVIGQEVNQTKKVYGFHQKQTEKSKSPLAVTPLKNAKNRPRQTTPVKGALAINNLTQRKKPSLGTTPVKTAKK